MPLILLFIHYSLKFNIFLKLGSIPISYKAPKNLDILEVALLKDNFFHFGEIKPAILEFINLGLIKLKYDGKGYLLKRVENSSIRLQNHQLLFLHSIFKNANYVPVDAIRIRSYHHRYIEEAICNSLIKKGLYYASLKYLQSHLLISVIFYYIITTSLFLIYSLYKYNIEINTYSFFPIIALVFIGYRLIYYIKTNDKSYIYMPILLFIISIISILYYFDDLNFYLYMLLLLFVSIFVGAFLYHRVTPLTREGIEAKREICGLKEFIKRANIDKIDMLQKENKDYLNRLLPYATLFGLSEHWLNISKAVETLNANFDDLLDDFLKYNLKNNI